MTAKAAVTPSPKDIIIDILVAAEGWGLDEELRREMEENVFVMSLVGQIITALTHFGWLRSLPKTS